MSFQKCVSCRAPIDGPTIYTYVTWWVDKQRFSFRQGACTGCAAELRNQCALGFDSRDEDDVWHPAAGVVVESMRAA